MDRLDSRTDELTRFALRVRERLGGPARIVLFGSRARGDALRDSDYDFLVVSQAFDGLGFGERAIMVDRAWDLPEPIEVLCYTPREYERKRREIGIVSQAEREGVLILDG